MTVTALASTFSDRILHLWSGKERYRRSFRDMLLYLRCGKKRYRSSFRDRLLHLRCGKERYHSIETPETPEFSELPESEKLRALLGEGWNPAHLRERGSAQDFSPTRHPNQLSRQQSFRFQSRPSHPNYPGPDSLPYQHWHRNTGAGLISSKSNSFYPGTDDDA
ncbi:hypothetical protein NFI96_008912 [Prochilodus magdalenae]|nr:hypothetical protein NFI96_008912 [Prochilodus magdalenae]